MLYDLIWETTRNLAEPWVSEQHSQLAKYSPTTPMVQRIQGALSADMRIILIAGVLVLAWKCWIVYPVSHIGHNDAMGYAEMADSLLHGRGLSVDYVSFHFIQYPGIPRPEDHWPPLYSFLILPFYLVLGKVAIAFKLPSLIIASVCLPMATYVLTRHLSHSRWPALGSAFTVMLYPKLFFWSLFCLSDITYTFFFLLVVLFALRGFGRPVSFYWMGITIGVAYYAKGSALLLIPALMVFYLVKRPSLKKLVHDRHFLLGIALALCVMSPFWIRNTVHYGNPLHSTQNYWSGNIGYSTDGPSNGNTYRVYWDKTAPSWMATKRPLGWRTLAQKSWQYFDRQFQWAFVNMGHNEPMSVRYWLTLKPARAVFAGFPSYPNGIPIGLFGIPALLVFLFMPRRRDIYIIPLMFGALLLFLSVMWAPIDRLILVSVPLVIALGWTAYHALLSVLLRRTTHTGPITAALLVSLAVVTSAVAIRSDHRSWQSGRSGSQPSFTGRVDEVRIYRRALTDEEISTNAQTLAPFDSDTEPSFVTDGLVSFWSFDRQSIRQGVVQDQWGQNHGLMIGRPKLVQGKVGDALAFDGRSCVEIPGSENLQLGQAFTVETWVQGEHPPVLASGITQWMGKGGNYVLSWDHNRAYAQSIAFRSGDGKWPGTRIEEPLQANAWHHVTGSWDGNALRIYLDGRLVSESQFTAPPVTDASPLRLGGTTVGGWFPYSNGPFEREQLLLAQWIRENTPSDAVIMDCDPWALQFYSDRHCVHFACDTPDEIFRVMRHYGVTHITYDTYEAAHPKTLDDYYTGSLPGFEMLYAISSRLKLYRVHDDLLR